MELKYLQTFKTIIEEGSFSRAAEKLSYTQSTITFQVQQLEQELSAPLFEKIGRRMVLTKAGEKLIPYVDEVLSSVDKMKNFTEDLSQLQGDLHVAAAETMMCYKIPAVLKKFHEQAPQARLFLRSMNCYDIRDALLKGSIDLGVFYQDIGGLGSSLTTYPIGQYPLALVASPKIRKQFPDFITPGQQLPLPFIINEPACVFRQIFEAYLKEKDITLDHTIELWSIPTIKNLVKNDMGVSYLPSFSVKKELEDGELCTIDSELDGKIITAVCGRHKNKWISPLMQLFIDLVCQYGSV
ncbi:LysR family transcriptional regulator [Anaerovorax odorimutans]|uniref:LysR family transcriptional regulator n=1 Tax=Anaerovorax odorimutans TaxID=109327 RepID=A0ABT1RQT6_9FIRM|nr:LysR family transcriptional regulator [Anaerovorax odorimutans]MCQ4637540.1 LysR family transcriptional regulator [Anaerovorax odorimutans]